MIQIRSTDGRNPFAPERATTMTTTQQHTESREAFLQLRDAVGLPRGGEVVHRHEIEIVADHFGLEYSGWTKPRIIFELVKSHYYSYDTRTWEEAQEGERDYSYLQSREARGLAEAAQEVNNFGWGE